MMDIVVVGESGAAALSFATWIVIHIVRLETENNDYTALVEARLVNKRMRTIVLAHDDKNTCALFCLKAPLDGFLNSPVLDNRLQSVSGCQIGNHTSQINTSPPVKIKRKKDDDNDWHTGHDTTVT